ncbi:MAG: hypothetical protein CVU56_07770 [Deltaproteobacteria bacterium HGW-Deltaproteobacteria-14]|nr:MAG: hypothetical protein CVU56_07770 [Deltaproteobacteria bacterium HGW-Deltaproteobacteria-14]
MSAPAAAVDAPVEAATGPVGDPSAQPNRRAPEIEGHGADDAADDPATRDAYGDAMIRGEAALYSGRFEQARVAYLEAMELRPDSTAPALGALRSMVIEGHAEARGDIAERIRHKIASYAERADTQGAANLLAARLALALGETGTALDEARLAVHQMPELGVAWRVLGEAAMAAELWGEAVESLQTAVSLGLQAEAGSWERLADAFDELGETGAAVDAARQALKMTGRDKHARRRRLNLLGCVLKHAGDLEGATDATEQARALGPDDPAVLHNLGALAQARSEPDKALALWQQATKEVAVPTTLWRMGKLLLELDRPNDALIAFKKAAANLARWSWPESTRWLPAYEVGKLFARANLYKEAIGWFEDAQREARTADATREIVSWLGYVKTLSVEDASAAVQP